jgi:hypothetical protein
VIRCWGSDKFGSVPLRELCDKPLAVTSLNKFNASPGTFPGLPVPHWADWGSSAYDSLRRCIYAVLTLLITPSMDKCSTKSRKNPGHGSFLPIPKLQLAEAIPAVHAQASTDMSLRKLSKSSLRQAQGELLQDEEILFSIPSSQKPCHRDEPQSYCASPWPSRGTPASAGSERTCSCPPDHLGNLWRFGTRSSELKYRSGRQRAALHFQ